MVCDRYRASSVAYGEAQGLDAAWLRLIQQHLPAASITSARHRPRIAVSRKQSGRDRFERDLNLLARVRDSYLRQAREDGWVVISAEGPKNAVAAAVTEALAQRLGRLSGREQH